MTTYLPASPSLETLKKQAKDLLRSHRRGDDSCLKKLRSIKRFAGFSDDEVLQTNIHLNDAQFAVALEYGFRDWKALKHYVEPLTGIEVKRGIENLQQPTFFTSRMSMLKGPLDYYGIDVSTPTVFGGSGHGFLINVGEWIAEEDPYVWNGDNQNPLIENLGLRVVSLGWYTRESSKKDIAEVETKLRDAFDNGVVCALHTGVNQLITGYDEAGFFTTSPHNWSSRLTFGSWQDLRLGFALFYLLEKVQPSDRLTTVLDSLDYAVDLSTNPSNHDGAGIGPDKAYTNWIKGVDKEHPKAAPGMTGGSGFGNFLNGSIWSECRFMVSRYFAEVAREFHHVAGPALQLQNDYADIAAALDRLKDTGMDSKTKVDLLVETRTKEILAIERVSILAALLRETQTVLICTIV